MNTIPFNININDQVKVRVTETVVDLGTDTVDG